MAWSLKQWRRERVLRNGTVDAGIWETAIARFPFTRTLDLEASERLRDHVILFLNDKALVAAGEHELTDEMRLDIAIQACILVLNLDTDAYAGWNEVIVYPGEFVPGHTWTDEHGIVHEDDDPRAGEAWLQGPVILSWADVERAGDEDGVNVVIHEFAHKLDMLNGDANGFPPLHKEMSRSAWSHAFEAAYADFTTQVDRGRYTEIDPYAAESPAEFFAVLSEAFFETPRAVVDAYPLVYEQLRQFYRQDPLARIVARAH
ncbi:MAG: zinc-dependent peptidase [Burkholderiales bacterium]|nr:zinc-dependent peptidase [Burkholderiales bacterium]